MNGTVLIKNMSWKFAERIMAQIVTFIVSIILARILEPSDYGIISLVIVFITIANVFVVNGLGNALIQKKDADALDFSSALYFNIFFSILLYIILFIIAPFIAQFFGEGYEILSPILRILGLRIIVAAINSIQQAYVSRKMIFQKYFVATLWGTILSAFVGIWMAYKGYGPFALVGQYLANTLINTIVLSIILHKKPLIAFSVNRVKKLFDYGIKILGSGLLIAVFTEGRSFIIGKIYTSSDLAYYDKARQFPSLFVNNIVTTISAVLFPKMSSEQEDIEQVKTTMIQSIRFTTYLMCPLMFGLASVAESLVRFLLTEKWISIVPILQILCITYLWQPIHTTNIQAINAIGRSDVYFKLEIIKKSIEIVVLVCVMFISVNAIVISMAVNATMFMVVNNIPIKKYLGYSLMDQIKDMAPAFIISSIMAIVIWFLNKLPINNIIILIVQIITGVFLYCILSKLSNNKEYNYLIHFIKNKNNIL